MKNTEKYSKKINEAKKARDKKLEKYMENAKSLEKNKKLNKRWRNFGTKCEARRFLLFSELDLD